MVAYVTETAAGRWFWYKLDPADLAVNPDDEIENGLTILWRGGVEVDRLKAFFEKAASRVCTSHEHHYRASFMTHDGPTSFPFSSGENFPIPQNAFVTFECFSSRAGSTDSLAPVFTVFAAFDKEATSLDDLQESVGVSLNYADLPLLQNDIVDIVSASSSVFFPAHSGYNPAVVLNCLGEIRSDIPALLSH